MLYPDSINQTPASLLKLSFWLPAARQGSNRCLCQTRWTNKACDSTGMMLKKTGTTAGATKSPSSPDPCVVEKVWERREICLLPPSSGGSIQDHNSCSTSSLCPCCPSSSCHMAQVQQSAGSVQDHNSCSTSSLCPCCPSSSCHMAQVQQSAGSVQDHNSCSTSSLCPCCPSSSCHMAQVQ